LNAEHKTKDEKINYLSGNISSMIENLSKVEIDTAIISGVLSSLLNVSSKTAIKKANKGLEDFEVKLTKGNDVVKLTADIVDGAVKGSYIVDVTDVIDTIED
jgi:hypothetical protein